MYPPCLSSSIQSAVAPQGSGVTFPKSQRVEEEESSRRKHEGRKHENARPLDSVASRSYRFGADWTGLEREACGPQAKRMIDEIELLRCLERDDGRRKGKMESRLEVKSV